MKSNTDMIRKAAVLVSNLDSDTADKLLEQMPPETADLVRRAWTDLENVDPAEQEAVIGEFFGRDRDSTPAPAESAAQEEKGVELSEKLAREFGLAASVEGSAPASAHPADASPFEFLHGATMERVALLLEGENPQAIALVVSHLPPKQALAVLATLSQPIQAEVLRRMAFLGETDREILREVEQGLQSRMSAKSEQEQAQSSRLTAVTHLLQHATEGVRRTMLLNLARNEPGLAEQLGYSTPETLPLPSSNTKPSFRPPARFHSLDELNDAELSAAFQAADPELATLALAGASAALIQRVVRRFGPTEGQRFRRALDRLGPTRLSDIDQAQQELLSLAESLAASAENQSNAGRRELMQAA